MVHEEVYQRCPKCDFGFTTLDSYYSFYNNVRRPVEAKLITDKAGILNSSERKMTKRTLISFAKRFPGLFFTVYLDSAKDHDEADSKSLWLINKARFTDLPETAHSQYGFMLYIDANKKAVAMSYGSGLDTHLRSKDTFSIIKASHPEFYRGRYYNAIKKTVHQTSSHLAHKCPIIKIPSSKAQHFSF